MIQEIKELFAVGSSADYAWNEFRVYQHPLEPRKYVVDSDSGCSCDWYETPSLATLKAETPLGKREVYKAFSEWWDSADSYGHEGTKIDNFERLRSSL